MLSRSFQIDNKLESKLRSLECTNMVNSIVDFLAVISLMIDVKACTNAHSDNNFCCFTLKSHNPIFSLKS